MARRTRKAGGRSSASSDRRNAARRNGSEPRRSPDAIALLKADHREVEGLFAQFEKTSADGRKRELAKKICAALKAHTAIEEEIFYPAFLEATDDKEIHHEAEVEHDGAKKLIAEIEAGPGDDYFDARVTVLAEMIKHHVKEEEKRGGMFTKARQADMDLDALGEQLQTRKDEVMADNDVGGQRGRTRGMARGRVGAMLGRGNRKQQDAGRRP